MRATRTGILALAAAAGLATGHAASRLFAVRVEERELSGLEWGDAAPDGSVPAGTSTASLAIRLVDAGGVGIPADTAAWGSSYSHATYAFDRLILDRAPWVDAAELAALEADWRRYVGRMASYGNNAVVLDAFLELINFDRVGDGTAVYPRDDPLRARHEALRAAFASLVADARAAGLGSYLKTDLPALSPELEAHLRRVSPSLDTADPAFWEVYAAGLDELFAAIPDLDGVVVRVGEAGPLFNAAGSAYSSYLGVRRPDQLRLMLRSLLPVFERHGKRMIFRSWSIGVGPLGHLHDDPALYEAVLGDIDSPALVVSTKFVRGDYFGFLPLNPTLRVGRHRRLVEFQARREFEGFGALADYMADAHRRALLQLRAANPNVIGVQLWTQEGGPLRAGPLSLYTVAGFWRWTDANVYATSRLMVDPTADPRALAEEWARATMSPDPEVAAGLADVLMDSRRALEQAIYIRPYATQRVEMMGVETPPILWIFEWDVIGGWSSVQSTLYRALGTRVPEAVAEGFAAVRISRSMQARLAALEPKLGRHPDWPAMVRSLAYQESLYETLAWYRAAFLGYYGWLDHGGAATWRAAGDRFLAAAADHEARFGTDLDVPAFDFTPAIAAMERAREGAVVRVAARGLLAALLVLLVLGTPLAQRWSPAYAGKRVLRAAGMGAASPWRLGDAHDPPRGLAWGIAGAVTAVAALTVALVLPAGSTRIAAGSGAVLLSFAAPLWWSWRSVRHEGSRHAVHAPALLGPLVWAAVPPLAVVALRGPDYFWFLFWSEGLFRTATFAVPLALAIWTLASSHALGRRVGGLHSFAGGSLLLAAGCALLVLSGLLPDLAGILAALDEPLHLLPMRPAIINGITHYAGVPPWSAWVPGGVGVMLMAGGLALRWAGSERAPAPTLAGLLLGLCIALPLDCAAQAALAQNPTGGINSRERQDAPYVVLVSFDGFRPDYLDRHPTPAFHRVIRRGVRAERMIPVFPSKTFPSHYTMATGLYADRHGLVGNTFEDPRRPGRYAIGDRATVEDSTWYGGEPIWVTAEKQGMVAATYFWVGSEAAVQGVRPTFWHRLDATAPASEARVDSALAWLAQPPERRPHLITMYFSETDGAGHAAGPDSPEVAAAVARVDSLLGRLLDGLDRLPHAERVTLILVSDHGMAGYGMDDLIVLDTARLAGVRIAESGPYASLFVPGAGPARLRAVRDTVRAMVGESVGVYLRDEVPARFHYSGHPAVGDLVLVPRGRQMLVPSQAVPRYRPGFTHGWDNRLPEMGALFLAMGPRLPADTVIAPFESVHLYPLMTELLGLDPAPVDGTLDVWTPFLRPERRR